MNLLKKLWSNITQKKTKGSCSDCQHCKIGVGQLDIHLKCFNPDAIQKYQTNVPRQLKCVYWSKEESKEVTNGK